MQTLDLGLRPHLRTSLVSILALVTAAACAATTDEETSAAGAAQVESTCGDGVRDPSEQCDDGNTANLDGCSSTCQFEQIHRIDALSMMFDRDSYCTANALGGAVGSVAQGQLQDAVTAAVDSGALTVLFPFLGLSDLTGQSGSFTLGSLVGDPIPNVQNGVDAWYTANPSTVTPDGQPLVSLPATLTNANLAVGPGNLALTLNFGGTTLDARLSGARLKAKIGASSAPATSSGSSPGHLASEHVDPALRTFTTTTGGQICGNVSAASLAAVPVPPQLQSGSTACSQGYTAANSLLDVFASGCRVFLFTALSATQPDQADPSVPAAGAGAPYALVVGSGKKVTGCKDRSGASVELGACLKSAAYSTAFKFTSERAIVHGTSASAAGKSLY